MMGASLALAGLTACTRQPDEKIVPYVKPPEEIVPGRPLFFATAVLDGGYAKGVLVESHEGRPTKIEGNPDHPASLGATDAVAQAAILELYDPDRSQTLTHLGEIRPWGAFLAAVQGGARGAAAAGRRGAAHPHRRPSPRPRSRRSSARSCSEYPQARWHQWEPTAADNARAGAALAFGQPAEARYRPRRGRRDPLARGRLPRRAGRPACALMRAFSARRRVGGRPTRRLNRLYVVEGSPSLDRCAGRPSPAAAPSEVEGFARARGGRRSASRRPAAAARARAVVVGAGHRTCSARGARCAGDGGRVAAAGGARAGPRDQRALGAVGQTVTLRGAGRARAGRSAGGSLRELARRHGGRAGGHCC